MEEEQFSFSLGNIGGLKKKLHIKVVNVSFVKIDRGILLIQVLTIIYFKINSFYK